MSLVRRALAICVLLCAVLAAPAGAAVRATPVPVLAGPPRAGIAVARPCFAAPLPAGTPGAVIRHLTVPATGLLDARLDGSAQGADWDLAVFNAAGRRMDASAAFGGNEVVRTPAVAG